jgi:ketosteroid isomerase-like protein
MRFFLLAAVLWACADTAAAQAESADPIIAAERAFAADAAQRGWAAAFRSTAATDAITLSPGPVNAHQQLAGVPGDGETSLDWRPAYAGIARSGDFGFTTGPFQFRGREGIVGHYFTVWRLQPDGQWKWVFDAGTDVRDPGPAVAPDADIPTLPVAELGSRSTSSAIGPVRSIEVRMAGGSGPNGSALAVWLAADARVNRPGAPAAVGVQAAATLARTWRVTLDFAEPLRMESSAAGDMVFSMGEAHWSEERSERRGYYARIWQLRPEGWRVVFDEIVPHRGG